MLKTEKRKIFNQGGKSTADIIFTFNFKSNMLSYHILKHTFFIH